MKDDFKKKKDTAHGPAAKIPDDWRVSKEEAAQNWQDNAGKFAKYKKRFDEEEKK